MQSAADEPNYRRPISQDPRRNDGVPLGQEEVHDTGAEENESHDEEDDGLLCSPTFVTCVGEPNN
jgi:hypothetical protein